MRCALCVIVGTWLVSVPAQGPTAHWRLDETMGTVAADSSPNANNGTLVGFPATPWTTGVHAGALTFSGLQHVDCMLNAGLPMYDTSGSPFTLAAWVNGPPQDDDRFYSEGSNTSNNPLYTLGSGRNSNNTPDRFQLFVRNDANSTLVNMQSAGVLFDNTWHHIAVVDVGGAVTVYIDGVPDSANFNYVISGTQTNINRVALGAVLRATACCQYTGTLDDFRIYPFALSAVDVGIILNDGPLVAGYQVNQPGASLLVDGVNGSQFSAAPVSLALGQAFDLVASSGLGGNLWEMVVDSGAAIPNQVVFAANIVNLNLGSPTLTFLNSNFSTAFGVAPSLPGIPAGSATASATVGLTAPGSATNIALQFAVLDPGSVDGFAASGPANISVQ